MFHHNTGTVVCRSLHILIYEHNAMLNELYELATPNKKISEDVREMKVCTNLFLWSGAGVIYVGS